MPRAKKTITDIKSAARTYTNTALLVLVGIMSSRKAQHSARVTAATALLDRGWGKAHQATDITIDDKRDDSDTIRQVEELMAGTGAVKPAEKLH